MPSTRYVVRGLPAGQPRRPCRSGAVARRWWWWVAMAVAGVVAWWRRHPLIIPCLGADSHPGVHREPVHHQVQRGFR
jgi:hypothetical protein